MESIEAKNYLIKNNWFNVSDSLWVDLTGRSTYECHESVAVEVQKYRDRMKSLPWYKKLINKIFK